MNWGFILMVMAGDPGGACFVLLITVSQLLVLVVNLHDPACDEISFIWGAAGYKTIRFM